MRNLFICQIEIGFFIVLYANIRLISGIIAKKGPEKEVPGLF